MRPALAVVAFVALIAVASGTPTLNVQSFGAKVRCI
jgi:hypothetical protein